MIQDPLIPEVWKILSRKKETRDTFTLELIPEAGKMPRPFRPGQFNMLMVHGVGEIPISISGDPRESKSMIHTIRDVGSVSAALGKLSVGSPIGIRGPYGSPWPVEKAEGNDVLLVAGGIGLAPLRPALYRLMAHRERYGRIILLYGARTPEEILFRRELEKWRTHLDLDVLVTVDRGPMSWHGNVGFVTQYLKQIPLNPFETTAMICGPELMIRYAVEELLNLKMKKEEIFVSLERNMKCGNGTCGHCQLGEYLVCRDGPVFMWSDVESYLEVDQL